MKQIHATESFYLNHATLPRSESCKFCKQTSVKMSLRKKVQPVGAWAKFIAKYNEANLKYPVLINPIRIGEP